MRKFKRGKCSSAIWKKFNEDEKAFWQLFYDAFCKMENLPTKIKMTDEQIDVLAHNMACQAVWAMREIA